MHNLLFNLLAFVAVLNQQSGTAALAKAIREYAIVHHFSGSVVVEEDGKKVYEASYGLANRAFDVPCKPDTRFHIASITKAFTSAIVLKLVGEGKVDLHHTINTYLPSYKGEGAAKVTVEELLNHTSGIQNLDSSIKSPDDALRHGILHDQLPFSSDEMLDKFCGGKLVHEPGKVFDYNNGEYIILGKIIERVTGKVFDQVLRDFILGPLGMKNSGMLYQRDIVNKLASCYWSPDGKVPLINNMPVYPENWYAAGGMYSTTGDLLSFADALYSGKIIGFKSLNKMLEPGLDGYGYGLWVGYPKFGGKQFRNVNRPGGIMGANGSFYHFNGVGFSKTINIVILSNTNQADMDGFSWKIGETLLK